LSTPLVCSKHDTRDSEVSVILHLKTRGWRQIEMTDSPGPISGTDEHAQGAEGSPASGNAIGARIDARAARRQRRNNVVTLVIEAVGVITQLLLVYAGVRYLFLSDDFVNENGRLVVWCVLATLYLGGTVFWLNIDLRVNREDHQLMRKTSRHPIVAIFSAIVTFSSSLVGLSAAVTVIVGHGDPDYFNAFELIAVWAMLSSWAMFHWGYSRIYYATYLNREAEKPLVFPGTEHPRLIDFVYFSFTLGTSFAASDVMVSSTRMRWTVVWHSAFSFFFNALIIVLTMNTISGAFQGLS